MSGVTGWVAAGWLMSGKLASARTASAASSSAVTGGPAAAGIAGVRWHRFLFWDVVAVASVMEEIGHDGAIASAYKVQPDLAIALDVTYGKGKVFIFTPEVTFRAQPHATYKFLFNALVSGPAGADR